MHPQPNSITALKSATGQARTPVAASGFSVSFDDVWRRYGSFTAVGGVSLHVEAGEFFSLLGPSGSGKTTLLMMLAGFEQPQSGRIVVGSRDLTNVAPNKRDVAMVFQRYALFPHMTVAENIAFPLRMRGFSKTDQKRRVEAALDMVRLTDYAGRRPAELSGGQQQRVALARAIVFEPSVILMDEPLGALDKKLRHHMQVEIKQLQQRLGATVVYVTHDQEEALTMSDRVAVMNHGQIAQVGTPKELYDKPSSAFVAGFVGEMNFLAGEIASVGGSERQVRLNGTVAGIRNGDRPWRHGEAVTLAIRPENFRLAAKTETWTSHDPGISGHITQIIFNGANTVVLVGTADGTVLRVDLNSSDDIGRYSTGDEVMLSWRIEDAHIFAAGET